MLDLRAAHEPPQQTRDRNHRHEDRNDDPLAGDVLLGAVDLRAVLLGAARGAQRLRHAADNRAHDLDERPDGGDRHDARADETHVRLEDCRQGVSQVVRALQLAIRVQGQQDAVGNHHADEHRNAHRHTDQVAHADQGEGQGGGEHRARRTDLESGADLGGRHLQVAEQGHRRRGQSAPGDREQAALVILAGIRRIANLEDLSARHALGVRQIRTRHERATQRNRIHDAQRTADRTHEHGLPVREAAPPADDHEAGEDEDDRRQCARRRRDCLNDVVLLDRMIAPEAQNRHRNNGRRNRRCERQTDLQTQIHVRSSEHQRDNAADDDATQGQFFERRLLRRSWRRHEKSFRCVE